MAKKKKPPATKALIVDSREYEPFTTEEEFPAQHSLLFGLLLILFVYLLSTFVFHTLEGWSYLDSVYYTTVTITTIGYGDFTPKTDYGKIAAIFLAWFGISIAFYFIYTLGMYRRRVLDSRLKKRLNILRNLTDIKSKRN